MPAISAAPLTQSEIRQLAADWYHLLDVHAPLEEVLPLLDEAGAEMRFPEATLRGSADFAAWYERVTHLFFDEVHTLSNVEVELRGEEARVDVAVHWEASVWKAPAPRSERIRLTAYQTWTVRRSEATGRPVIATYSVDRLEYDANSARL